MPNRKPNKVTVGSHSAGHAVRRATVRQPSGPIIRLPSTGDNAMTEAEYANFIASTDNVGPVNDLYARTNDRLSGKRSPERPYDVERE